MERLKLNIQLFGGSLAITAYETDVDINNNTSYIYVELKPSTNSTTFNENNSAYVQATLTGQNDTFTIPKTYFNIGKGKTVTAYSGKIGPFRHNADGSLNNVSISASCYIVSNTQPTATASVAMSTIPRASSISSITGDQIGSNVTVTISRASSSFTHKIQVIYGEKRTDWISFGSNTSATFTIPMDFCNSTYLQNTDNGQFIFWLSTESNGTTIGTTQTLKTMYVPSSVKPTISSVTKSDTANLANTYGGYVQGKSGLRIQTSASGAYGSSITGCVVTIKNSGGTVLRTLNGTDVTISNISYTGTLTIVSTVTDSRNRSVSNTSTVSVLAYSAPVVEYFTASRVSGNEGTVKLTWKASITSLNSHNGKNFYVYYRQNGGSWTQLTSKTDAYSWQNDNYTTAKAVANSWDFKFECWDNFTASNHIIKTAGVIGAFKLVNYKADGTGIAFGKYSEKSNDIELGMHTTQSTPAGTYTAFEIDASDKNEASIAFYNNGKTKRIVSGYGTGQFDGWGVYSDTRGSNILKASMEGNVTAPYGFIVEGNNSDVASWKNNICKGGVWENQSSFETNDFKHQSFVGSTNVNGTWYNIINTRHRNGGQDGNTYGLQIRSLLTTKGSRLEERNQIGDGSWSNWRGIPFADEARFLKSCSIDANGNRWQKLGKIKFSSHAQGDFAFLKIFIGAGNNGNYYQNAYIDMTLQFGWTGSVNGRVGCYAILYPCGTDFTPSNTYLKVISISNIEYDIYFMAQRTYVKPNVMLLTTNLGQEFIVDGSFVNPSGTECDLLYKADHSATELSSGDITCTKSGGAGNVINAKWYRKNNTVQIKFNFGTTSTTAVGSNVWTGTLTGIPMPVDLISGCAFFGSACYIGSLQTNGTFTVRVIGSQSTSNTGEHILSLTYLTNDY